MQWSEILSEIKRMLKEPVADGTWTDPEYLRRANIIQRNICRDSECISVLDSTNLSVVGQTLYNKLTNILKIKEVRYGNPKLYEIDRTTLDLGVLNGSIDNPWQEVAGTPTNFYQTETQIGLYPNPDNADDVISILSINQADDIVDTTDVPFNGVFDLTDAHDLIISGVVYRCMLEDRNKFYTVHKKEYSDGVLKLRRERKERQNVMQTFSLLNKPYSRNIAPLPVLGE